MSIKWWEKTVEYFYIMSLAQQNLIYVAPLDGQEESAGDTIASINNKWILIEFKKDYESIKDEIRKFISVKDAESHLAGKDNHHFLVYGFSENNKFTIRAQTYFGAQEADYFKLHLSGICHKEFLEYIHELISYKKTNKDKDNGGNGKLFINNYSIIAGINNNKIIKCMTVNEFINYTRNLNIVPQEYQRKSHEYKREEISFER